MGPIAGAWLPASTKQAILLVIATAQTAGVSARCSCAILAIAPRRVGRWQAHVRQGVGLADAPPGPREALHRLRPEEIECITAMAQSQEYVDLSHRILAVTAWDQGRFFASFSTVYRVLKAGAEPRGQDAYPEVSAALLRRLPLAGATSGIRFALEVADLRIRDLTPAPAPFGTVLNIYTYP